MSWNNETPSATMTAQQFKIVFQVTKEVHSVPEERFAAAEIPPEHTTEILGFARDIRKALSAGGVEVHFVSPDPSDRRTLRIQEPSEAEGSWESSREFPSDVAGRWRSLINVTVASLGPDELRFRTGYGKAEVDSACSPLGTLFGG
ncbi:hypothetical protein [Streptomyces sp. NBC_01294]|uniref:hypothetical protein n=1 Tax=Streptomyces sp. NBC_01294 TaxID=2903815 RepID=UPI002DD98248|nr:hypothetical protein [Streptomyces sp. NBC_01294]WRZ57347.1 hypothetical protein OG534_13155 [Streptomyces sp. NBC_01294]